jgi:hypothetical protein
MVAIISVHVTTAPPLTAILAHRGLSLALATPFKFGTIGFFLVSGFLMGERVDRCDPFQYFAKRTKRIFFSWLAWFSIYAALNFALFVATDNLGRSNPLKSIYWTLSYCLFYSAYWFVPNFLIGLATILALRRFLYTLQLGIFLLAINLVYVVNIYRLWFPSLHTQAIFGFVFYLWLGSYIAHHFDSFNRALSRFPMAIFIILAFATAALSYGETTLLRALHNPDPLNTLRASNQLFSLSIALLLFKIPRPTWPSFIDVRRYTFGIYLTHTIITFLVLGALKLARQRLPVLSTVSDFHYLCAAFTLALLTYFLCVRITAWFAESEGLQWMVGVSSPDSSRPSVRETARPTAFSSN